MTNKNISSPGTQELMKSSYALEASTESPSASHHEHNINNDNTLFSEDFHDQDLTLEEQIRLARAKKNIMRQSVSEGSIMEATVYRNEFGDSVPRHPPYPLKKRGASASAMPDNPEPQSLLPDQKSYLDDEYEVGHEIDARRTSLHNPAPSKLDDSHRYAHAQRVQKTSVASFQKPTKNQMFSHEDLVPPSPKIVNSRPKPDIVTCHRSSPRSSPKYGSESPLFETRARQTYFQPIGENLAPSRYSGAPMPWGVNKQPPAIAQDEVSDAALLKRGLKRGKGEKVVKRGYGANDPENIAIVNMKEKDKLSFDEITKTLNEKRILEGRNPTLSVCGVNGRYNRTAPLLYAAQGKEFVPLKQRRGAGARSGELDDRPIFNDETDIILVQCVKDVEAQKWFQVAQLFTELTGYPMNPKSAAIRHGML